MLILPLPTELEEYLKRRRLTEKYNKQKRLFEQNISHPSLNVELLEPTHLRFYSFRVDRKYRAIFIFIRSDVVEIIDINNHYR
jgi:plasmid maintenance system killer protein